MTIEEALVAHLKGLAGVTALVGTRIYPNRAPQKSVFPRVVLWNSSRKDITTVDGGAGGLPTTTFRVECQAESYASAAGVAAVLRASPANGGINGFRGLMGGVGGVFVQACFVNESAQDDEAPPIDSSDTAVHICGQDVTVTFEGA